jgi:hypothetical protein
VLLEGAKAPLLPLLKNDVPLGTTASAGHAVLAPLQVSATSQAPTDPRHTVLDGRNPSDGQAAALPVQLSATSHAPAEARHTVPAVVNVFTGHAALLPPQTS